MAGSRSHQHEARRRARIAAALLMAIVVSVLAAFAAVFHPGYTTAGLFIDLAHAPAMGIYGVAMAMQLAPARRRHAMVVLCVMAGLLTPVGLAMPGILVSVQTTLHRGMSAPALFMLLGAVALAVAAGGRFAVDRRWAWLPMGAGALAAMGMGALVLPGSLNVGAFSLMALPLHVALVWTLLGAALAREPVAGTCAACGDDMAGVPGETCPRCGVAGRRATMSDARAQGPAVRRAALASCVALAGGYAACIATVWGFGADLDAAVHVRLLAVAAALGVLGSLTLPAPRRWHAVAACLVAAGLAFVAFAVLGDRYANLVALAGSGGLTWSATVLLLILALPMALPALAAARSWPALLLTALVMDLSIVLALGAFHVLAGALAGAWLAPLLAPLAIPWLAALWLLAAHAAHAAHAAPPAESGGQA